MTVGVNIPRPGSSPPAFGWPWERGVRGMLRRWLRVPEPAVLEIGEVKRLSMQPGDILVYLYPGLLSRAAADQLRDQLTKLFDGRKIVVLDCGADFEVVSPPPPPSKDD